MSRGLCRWAATNSERRRAVPVPVGTTGIGPCHSLHCDPGCNASLRVRPAAPLGARGRPGPGATVTVGRGREPDSDSEPAAGSASASVITVMRGPVTALAVSAVRVTVAPWPAGHLDQGAPLAA